METPVEGTLTVVAGKDNKGNHTGDTPVSAQNTTTKLWDNSLMSGEKMEMTNTVNIKTNFTYLLYGLYLLPLILFKICSLNSDKNGPIVFFRV